MEIAFEDLQLRKVCEYNEAACEDLGGDVSEALQARIAEIRAAANVSELIAGNPRIVRDGAAFALSLQNHRSLIFEASSKYCPKDAQGRIVWPRVTRIKLLTIEGHNDTGD